jgi:hypothetical protein
MKIRLHQTPVLLIGFLENFLKNKDDKMIKKKEVI